MSDQFTPRPSTLQALQQQSLDAALRDLRAEIERLRNLGIPCLLDCPKCGEPHVDKPQPEKNWTNPPHRTHECQKCGHRWRPYDVATFGIENPIVETIIKKGLPIQIVPPGIPESEITKILEANIRDLRVHATNLEQSLRESDRLCRTHEQQINEMITRANKRQKEIDDFKSSFDLYERAITALTKAWHEAHPKQLEILPGVAEIAAWTANQLSYKDKHISDLKEPMECGHYGANLQPGDGNAEVCVVCAQVNRHIEFLLARNICPDCGKDLKLDEGENMSRNSPGSPAVMYCEDCGTDYPLRDSAITESQ